MPTVFKTIYELARALVEMYQASELNHIQGIAGYDVEIRARNALYADVTDIISQIERLEKEDDAADVA